MGGRQGKRRGKKDGMEKVNTGNGNWQKRRENQEESGRQEKEEMLTF